MARLTGVTALGAGGYHSCTVRTAGRLDCRGYNQYGELGNNMIVDSAVPVPVG